MIVPVVNVLGRLRLTSLLRFMSDNATQLCFKALVYHCRVLEERIAFTNIIPRRRPTRVFCDPLAVFSEASNSQTITRKDGSQCEK